MFLKVLFMSNIGITSLYNNAIGNDREVLFELTAFYGCFSVRAS